MNIKKCHNCKAWGICKIGSLVETLGAYAIRICENECYNKVTSPVSNIIAENCELYIGRGITEAEKNNIIEGLL